jgi:hypothetical protein
MWWPSTGSTSASGTSVPSSSSTSACALNDLVESVKRLGATLGVKAWMENRYKRVNFDANADSRAVAETAAANVKPK